jgi:phosphoglycolate phosphatase
VTGTERRVVLFDFDGTLADTFPRVERMLPRLARELRFRDPGVDGIRLLRERPMRQVLSELAIPPWKVPLVLWRARTLLAADPEPVRLFPGVADMLGLLDEAGLEWGILTSNGASLVRSVLRREQAPEPGWLEAGLGLWGKSGALRRMARRLGVAPHRMLLVSDETRDAEAARAAGVPMVGVAWGYGAVQALAAAGTEIVVEDVESLRKWILEDTRTENDVSGAPSD